MLLELAGLGDLLFFALPANFQHVGLLVDLGQFALHHLHALTAVGVGFLLQGLALNFQVRRAALQLVNLRRHGINLNAQTGRGFINQVYRLVGQEAVADVAMRKHGRRDDGRILDAHAMMHLVLFLQTAQNGNGVFHVGLADVDDLEAALKGRIFFDVLAILV